MGIAAVKNILLNWCLLFGVPANAETMQKRAILCGDMHAALFHSALGGAPYEHLRDVVDYYSDGLQKNVEEYILRDMMLDIYIELGKVKMGIAKFESGNRACGKFNLRAAWQ